MAKVQRRGSLVAPAASVPFTWVDHRRTVPTSDELENRRALLGLVNRLTFSNMDTISAQLVEGMKDPYLLGEAVELVFHQGLNPAWMVLFAHLCSRLTRDSPFFGRHGEINFRALLLNRYRAEFEQAVYFQVPSLAQLSAKCVVDSMTTTSTTSTTTPTMWGGGAEAEVEACLPQELVAYLRERPWVVTPKARDERWRRMNEVIVMLGEFYNVGLVDESQVTWMLGHLCDSIEQGMHRNVEPLCRLLATVGATLDARRSAQNAGSSEHLSVDQDGDLRKHVASHDVDDFVLPASKARPPGEEEEGTKGLDAYVAKVESYLQRVREWRLGERIRFMMQDVLDLKARNWQSRRAS